jgi:hypothetical protein
MWILVSYLREKTQIEDVREIMRIFESKTVKLPETRKFRNDELQPSYSSRYIIIIIIIIIIISVII